MIDLSFDVWKNILLALAVAFVISFAATPVVSSFAKKVGAIDIPDKKRHIHSHPIPRMGGLAIFLGFLLSVLLFANITPQVRGILLGAILIVMGFWRRSESFFKHAYLANVVLMTLGFILTGYQLVGYFVA